MLNKIAIRYFVGGLSTSIQGEPINLIGDIIFSAYYYPSRDGLHKLNWSTDKINLFLDSGAFQRIKEGSRITDSESLELQLLREQQLSDLLGLNIQAFALASNDRLIDEKHIDGKKIKQRWTVEEGELAVKQSIAAAKYLASQRDLLGDRILVLGCQGVDAIQYTQCVKQILELACPSDWIGLGGWCILGRQQKWMSTFRQTLINIIPIIARSPIKHVHIYGVMFEPALGNLLWMCDKYGLTLSTDSRKALSDCRWKKEEDRIKAGARKPYWQDNVKYWKQHLANFRQTPFYRSPHSGSTTKFQSKSIVQQIPLDLLPPDYRA